jgi:hypothetical protein
MNSFVVPELPVAHVSVIFDNFADMFRGQFLTDYSITAISNVSS